MGNRTRKIEGAATRMKGEVEKGIGGVLENHRLRSKGEADEIGGRAIEETARAEERAKGRIEQVAGSVERKAGEVLGNESMELAGKARQLKGAARRKGNQESGKVGWALLWLLGIPLPVLLVLYLFSHH